MRSVLRSGIAAVAFAFSVASANGAFAQDDGTDKIRKNDKSVVEGKIKSEDMKGATIEVAKGTSVTVTWTLIKSIDYAAPPEFKKAKAYVEAGSIGDALVILEPLKKHEGLRDVLKNHVLNWLAACQFRDGQVDAAIGTYKELFAAFPKSQFLLSGGENLVNCYLQKKDAAGAGQALDAMLDTAKKAGQDVTPFGLLRGRVKEAMGDSADAMAQYKQVEDSATDDSTKSAAQLGRARCLIAQKKAPEAEAIYRQITSSSKELPRSVMAGAWNGLGDIFLEAGKSKKDGDTIVNALFAYLRGCVQYVPEIGESTVEHERAIHGAAESFTAAGQLEKDPKRKAVYETRAKERQEYLQNKFPNSTYR